MSSGIASNSEESESVDDQMDAVEQGVSQVGLDEVDDMATSPSSQDTDTTDSDDSSYDTEWHATITKAAKAVVSIHFIHIAKFDTESQKTGEGIGFVVDADRGIILTNRHVVGSGPFHGYAVFHNQEEAALRPIFVDPVHNFAFLQFDRKEIKNMEVNALQLKPELAKVGTEIRVLGKDNDETSPNEPSIISTVDRNAPEIMWHDYYDLNTEYIQTADSASGGSPGSPAINSEGEVIAIQAGEIFSKCTDLFLPVYRPLRALRCIKQGEPVTRGDIQVKWAIKSYEECEELGLSGESQSEASGPGMVVAVLIIPKSPVENVIKEGDILISIENELITSQIRIDEILDEHVGKKLKFIFQRSGEYIEKNILIEDVYDITSSCYVEAFGITFSEVSYQLGLKFCIPIEGIYTESIKELGYNLLIKSIDDFPTPDLNSFIHALQKIPDRKKVNICYMLDMGNLENSQWRIDKHWNTEFRLVTRNKSTGLWDFKDLMEGIEIPKIPEPVPAIGKFPDFSSEISAEEDAEENKVEKSNRKSDQSNIERKKVIFQKLIKSSVQVNMSYCLPRESDWRLGFGFGPGFVIDAKHGYVITSRNLVEYDTSDVTLTFAGSIEVAAKIVLMHPFHCYAILKYDPRLILAEVRSLEFGKQALQRGNQCFLFGHNDEQLVIGEEVTISKVIPKTVTKGSYFHPRVVNIDTVIAYTKLEFSDGLLTDKDGTVRGFWFNFYGPETFAIDVVDVIDVINVLQGDRIPEMRIIEAEFSPILRTQAKNRGVSTAWISKFAEKSYNTLVQVDSVNATTIEAPDKACQLQSGDILLTMNDTLVSTMRDLSSMYKLRSLNLKIFREGKEMDLMVPTVDSKNLDPSRIIYWCGVRINAPTLTKRQQLSSTKREHLPSEIVIEDVPRGTIGSLYNLSFLGFITEVNDEKNKGFGRILASC